jgi:hypothetical protein
MVATKFRIGPFEQIVIGHPPLRALVAWRREIFLFDEAVEAVTEKETQHVIENAVAAVEKTRRITALASTLANVAKFCRACCRLTTPSPGTDRYP